MYYNYKNYFSIVLLAVADSNYCHIYVDNGSYGKDSDSKIFKKSTLWEQMENKLLNLLQPEPLPSTNVPVPYVFVGDEAFGLLTNLLWPYVARNLVPKKRIYNYRLSRIRQYVECTFGILSHKWRIFHRPIDVDIEFAVEIVKALLCLTQFCSPKRWL